MLTAAHVGLTVVYTGLPACSVLPCVHLFLPIESIEGRLIQSLFMHAMTCDNS